MGEVFKFMKHNQDTLNVITDSSDPMGPAESLKDSITSSRRWPSRRSSVARACQWLHLNLIKDMHCRSVFTRVGYAFCTIPIYPSGQVSFMLCGKNPSTNLQNLVQQLMQKQVEQM